MITLLSAIRAALGASCGPLPPHRPVTEADTLRREVAALQRACESHRREREAAERANVGLRAERDALADAVRRHKAARQRAGLMVRGLLQDLDVMRSERNAARAARGTAERQRDIAIAAARADRDAAIDRWRVVLGERDEARQALAAMTAERDEAVARAEIESANSESWAQYVRDMAEERDTAAAALAAMREAVAGDVLLVPPPEPAKPTTPAKTLRDLVAEELVFDGWKSTEEPFRYSKGDWAVRLNVHRAEYWGPPAWPQGSIDYLGAVPARSALDATIMKASRKFDAAQAPVESGSAKVLP